MDPQKIDIHNCNHRFELASRNLAQDPLICQENRAHIRKFVAFCRTSNLSLQRQLIYLLDLTVLARLHKAPFDEATKESILELMDRVKKRGLTTESGLSL